MLIGTIVPEPHLDLLDGNQFHMALAHLSGSDEYTQFHREQSGYVLMDNGVVETNVPPSITMVLKAADKIHPNEIVLPDHIGNAAKTIDLGRLSLETLRRGTNFYDYNLMAVPHGRTFEEWHQCLLVMLDWPIHAIGISRFNCSHSSRIGLLWNSPQLIESDLDIHLLGCPGDPLEIHEIDSEWPDRIRSVDSGIAAIYTQAGLLLDEGVDKPQLELDFDLRLDQKLLSRNILRWLRRARGHTWDQIREEEETKS